MKQIFDRVEAVRLYEGGLSLKAVGERLGVSKQAISQSFSSLLKTRSPLRPRAMIDLEAALRLLAEDKSLSEIAAALGAPYGSVRYQLRDAGAVFVRGRRSNARRDAARLAA